MLPDSSLLSENLCPQHEEHITRNSSSLAVRYQKTPPVTTCSAAFPTDMGQVETMNIRDQPGESLV